MVKAKEGSSYADVLRRIKEAPELKELSSRVVKIRRNAGGDLLLQLSRSADQKTQRFCSYMSESLKEMAEVRTLLHEPVLELKDLDELTTAEYICEAFKSQLEGARDAKVEVKSLRKAYGGTQTAVITLPTDLARRAILMSKIRIGWVISRIREKKSITKCFRCWQFGHLARRCSGPDRSKLCLRCGKGEHTSKECSDAPSCALCREAKRDSGHPSGGDQCSVYQQALQVVTRKNTR